MRQPPAGRHPVLAASSPRSPINGQPVAAVVAETLRAGHRGGAAGEGGLRGPGRCVHSLADPAGEGTDMPMQTKGWGDAEAALAAAPVRIEAEYQHRPRISGRDGAAWPHRRLGRRPADGLAAQPVAGRHGAQHMRNGSSVPFENVRLVSPYIGGGFGSQGLCLQPGRHRADGGEDAGPAGQARLHPAADLHRLVGGRAATRQTLALGATRDGKLPRSSTAAPARRRCGRLAGIDRRADHADV